MAWLNPSPRRSRESPRRTTFRPRVGPAEGSDSPPFRHGGPRLSEFERRGTFPSAAACCGCRQERHLAPPTDGHVSLDGSRFGKALCLGHRLRARTVRRREQGRLRAKRRGRLGAPRLCSALVRGAGGGRDSRAGGSPLASTRGERREENSRRGGSPLATRV